MYLHHLKIYEFLKIILFIYLFVAVVGLSCCGAFSLVVVSRGLSLVAMHRLPIAWLLLLQSMGSRT